MVFASPFWLLALLPWGALALWLLMGQRRDVGVPFLELWEGPAARPSQSRSLRRPPIYLVMTLLMLALAIIGASRPHFYFSASGMNEPLRVVVDTGLSLPLEQRAMLAKELESAVQNAFGDGAGILQTIPETQQVDVQRRELASDISALPHTAVDTRDSIAAALARVEQEVQPTIILTGHSITSTSENVIIIGPDQSLENISIASLAASDSGSPQVMVSILNQSPLTNATLTIRVGDSQPLQHQIELPPAGQRKNYFFDVPLLAEVISCGIDVDDDIKADNRRWLVRESAWPEIEARGTVPPELVRMIEVYARNRSSSRQSKTVAVTTDESQLSRDIPAAIIAGGSSNVTIDPAKLRVADHSVTANVNWDRARPIQLESIVSKTGWTPVVQHDDATLVAVRENPRRVRVAIDQLAWSRESDFVVFWTNVFNWLGEGALTYASYLPRALGPEWKSLEPEDRPSGTPVGLWPGLYQRNDGTRLAIHSPMVELSTTPPVSDWKSQIRNLARNHRAFVDLTPYFLFMSLIAALVAAMRWPSLRIGKRQRIEEQAVSG